MYVMRNLAQSALEGMPPPPPKFTLDEWTISNLRRSGIVEDQQQLAERIIAESQRVYDEVLGKSKRSKMESDHRLRERVNDLNFYKNEILLQRKKICVELDALEVYKDRIYDGMASVDKNAMAVVKKCLLLREQRAGIDLAHDDVELELRKEYEVIESVQQMLRRTLEQTQEQIRRIKSTFYLIDRDLEDKENALKIDELNTKLTEKSTSLRVYHGVTPLTPSDISWSEWSRFTLNNLEAVSKELNGASPLRAYIDTLLTQCVEDLREQRDATNNAFKRRIDETKEAKNKLELQHAQTVRKANEMINNINKLETAVIDMENHLALAHTRLGNRGQRSGVELCRDHAEIQLVNEISEIESNADKLRLALAEAQASLRYLMRCQIQLEEDINVKITALKIDEVDCMTLRQAMDYHAY
ncbi:tektin-1 [Chrysoperla carnea]|uniref:tektin-1 n=1 Tax=Chrysoperla carnea TaxID=189513 RepID=UPI001D08A986|nr:tektin-1 [Chrysoperla carnea]